MMLPLLWISSLVSVLLIQPWVVNKPMGNDTEPNFVFDPADLEFIEYECDSGLAVKDTLLCALVLALFVLAWWQWKSMKVKDEGSWNLFERSDSLPTTSQDAYRFHNDTEALFKELEMKYHIINRRFQKLEANVDQDSTIFQKQKDDTEFITQSWNSQYSTFGLQDLNPVAVSDWGMRMELHDLQENFDKEIKEIDAHISKLC